MNSWKLISQSDYNEIWNRFNKEYSFRPGVNPKDWPSIHSEREQLKLDITELWQPVYDVQKWEQLTRAGINAFATIVSGDEEIIVLDWQHDCYYVRPSEMSVGSMLNMLESQNPKPSFIPDGDYYIFLTKDFENVWFGHPWEKSITIVGDRLIKAYRMTGCQP